MQAIAVIEISGGRERWFMHRRAFRCMPYDECKPSCVVKAEFIKISAIAEVGGLYTFVDELDPHCDNIVFVLRITDGHEETFTIATDGEVYYSVIHPPPELSNYDKDAIMNEVKLAHQ